MPINYYIVLALCLFNSGVVGVLTRRNAIVVFMSVELMLNSVNLCWSLFKMHHAAKAATMASAGADGRCCIFVMAVAAAEVSVGLAIIVMLYGNIHTVDINFSTG